MCLHLHHFILYIWLFHVLARKGLLYEKMMLENLLLTFIPVYRDRPRKTKTIAKKKKKYLFYLPCHMIGPVWSKICPLFFLLSALQFSHPIILPLHFYFYKNIMAFTHQWCTVCQCSQGQSSKFSSTTSRAKRNTSSHLTVHVFPLKQFLVEDTEASLLQY